MGSEIPLIAYYRSLLTFSFKSRGDSYVSPGGGLEKPHGSLWHPDFHHRDSGGTLSIAGAG